MVTKVQTRLLKCGECGRIDADIVFRSPASVIAHRVGLLGREFKAMPWLYNPACPTCHSGICTFFSREASIAK